MAPQRKKSNRTTRRGRNANSSLEHYTTYGTCSPGSSLTVTWSSVVDLIHSSTFRIVNVSAEACATDTATANQLQSGPALLQLRVLAPDGKSTLFTGPVTLATSVRSRVPCNVDKSLDYVGPWRGDHLISLDCLCPKKGYEIGVTAIIKMTLRVYRPSFAEACPTYQSPTLPNKGVCGVSLHEEEELGSFTDIKSPTQDI